MQYKKLKVGTIIEARADGSYIYFSNKGILNLDNDDELKEAKKQDNLYQLTRGKNGAIQTNS